MISILKLITPLRAIISVSFFLIHISLYAGRLELTFENRSESPVNISFADSNYINRFDSLLIKEGETKKLNAGLSEGYFLQLNIINYSDNKLIDTLLISDNFTVNESFKNNIPAAGNIPSFYCHFNNSKRVSIRNIFGLRSLTWLPLCSSDYGRVDVMISGSTAKQDMEKQAIPEGSLSFTLFAIPDSDEAEEIYIGKSSSSLINLEDSDFNLPGREVSGVSLRPVLYSDGDISSRWADIIIHNYTFNSYILYSLISSDTTFQHISFDFKDSAGERGVVFYPPHTQSRGAAFRFGVMKSRDSEKVLLPTEAQRANERYTLLIGRQENETGKTLEYIPIEIHSSIYHGRTMSDGVNIKADDNRAYRVKFTPVNVLFYPEISLNSDEIVNSVRIPADRNGEPLFNLEAMVSPEIKNSVKGSGRAAAEYEIAAYSNSEKKMVKYRLILVAPTFIAGNTPGIFHPAGAVSSASSSGNFLRYPVHLYVIELDEKGAETVITGSETMTSLPEGLTGAIECFISDEI